MGVIAATYYTAIALAALALLDPESPFNIPQPL
jgi:hypothetical protein